LTRLISAGWGSVDGTPSFTALVWATAWGLVIWGDMPGAGEIAGAMMIVASGAYALSDVRT
jgi:drug/metabolite transporter (DMT)-like permease